MENIEREIWKDFKSISESSGLRNRLSYDAATAHFGVKYEDRNQLISRGLNKRLEVDEDYKINKFLNNSDFTKVDWDELLKLYPNRTPIILPRERILPEPKFRHLKERIFIDNFIKTKWDIDKLTLHSKIPNEKSAIEYLIDLRWDGNIACPRCFGNRIYSLQSSRQYKCPKCNLKFTEKVGTIFQNSNIGLIKWYEALYLMMSAKTQKISTPQLAEAIGTTQKTSWLMAHKIKSKISDDFLYKLKQDLLTLKIA